MGSYLEIAAQALADRRAPARPAAGSEISTTAQETHETEPEPDRGTQDATAVDRVREALRTVGRQRNGATTAEICLATDLPEDQVRAAFEALFKAGELELHDHPRQCYKLGSGPITRHGCETCRVTRQRP